MIAQTQTHTPRERPIRLLAHEVRGILDGRKTQVRRVIKPVQPRADGMWPAGRDPVPDCPHGRVGDHLWVKEAWNLPPGHYDLMTPREVPANTPVRYAVDGMVKGVSKRFVDADGCIAIGRKRPSIHMPRWASRILLEITEVRVQRVQEISEEDAIAEGAFWTDYGRTCHHGDSGCKAPDAYHPCLPGWSMVETESHAQCLGTERMAFANAWNRIHGPGAWDRNDWVWALTFRRIG